jgi:hypothetical protein
MNLSDPDGLPTIMFIKLLSIQLGVHEHNGGQPLLPVSCQILLQLVYDLQIVLLLLPQLLHLLLRALTVQQLKDPLILLQNANRTLPSLLILFWVSTVS